jgi:hypothetical protein
MIKTFSYRIKDSNCGQHLAGLAEAVNLVWNFCNETQHTAVRWDKRWPTAFDLNKLTTGSSRLLGLHSQTIQAVCEEYAIRRQEAHRRWLRWRSKRALGWIPFKASGIKLEGDVVVYQPRRYRLWLSRVVEGSIKTGTFSQDARRRWYINLHCECPARKRPKVAQQLGSPWGLRHSRHFPPVSKSSPSGSIAMSKAAWRLLSVRTKPAVCERFM